MNKVKKPLWFRMLSKIKRSDDRVFLHADFSRICEDDRQLRRGLKKLTDDGYLTHIGYGLYSKAKRSSLTGKVIPVAPLPDLGREAVKKLGYTMDLTPMEKGYLSGDHNQISTGRTLVVRGRCTRKIAFGSQRLDIQSASLSA